MKRISNSPLLKFSLFLIIYFFINASINAQKPGETAKLLPSDGEPESFFGNSVATDGEVAVIGEWFANNMEGATYVFRRNGDNWTEEAKLTASDGSSYDFFGNSVAINGDYLIIGATGANNKGAAYIFHKNGNIWSQTTKLTASNGADYDNFGSSVAISDDYAIVGASGAQMLKGAVYVFSKNGSNWQEDEMLTGTLYSTSFGSAVDISGEAIIIGASSSSYAFVFMLDGSSWIKVAELEDINGSVNDKFGRTVSIDGNLAVVGATHHQNGNGATGAAYIYHRQGSNWIEEEKLIADDGELDDHFGIVSLYGNTVVIGAYSDDDNGLDAGSAYIYNKVDDTWQFEAKLLASDGFAGDELGSSVAVFSDVIVAGAPNDNDNGTSSGSAYIFENNTQTGIFINPKTRKCTLGQNTPNPFKTNTTIRFYIPVSGKVKITVFDSGGKQIKILMNEFKESGAHQVQWFGTDENGKDVKAGLYYYQIIANKEVKYQSLMKL